MTSTKRLRSVIQSTAHHAMSGLCFIHDSLGVFCEARSLDKAVIDLMSGTVVTADKVPKPLRLSAKALQKRFMQILNSEGMQASDLLSATIEFHYRKWAWPIGCYINAETVGGVVEETADELGRRAEILKGDLDRES